ncbi:fatty acid desaturase family protein [Brevundimonas sp.]|uniref:fatty acid desaturase family protein n=1 Tax=Brevundimonas sp. TaxID=1871086 RepID=UPI002731ED80|nr:fatty acid desaturase [Brevundimonas sp.]MDP1912768.1 fatty acid desaturase [Brevundimonas sp.]
MPAAPRIRPPDLFTPDDWAPFQTRSPWMGPLLVAHCWAVIAAAVAVGVIWPILIPLSVAIIGTRQLGLAILMHEAAHGGLSSNRRLNEFLGHWLCAVPIGASLTAYRPYHLSHHKYAQQPEDPDLVLSAPFPVTRSSLRRKIVRDLTGQTFFKQRILFAFKAFASKRDEDPRSSSAKRDSATEYAEGAVVTGRSIAPFLLFNAALLLGATLAGVWWAYFALWLLPMATWFPMVTRLRNIAEHACVEGSSADPFRAARTTRASWWERALIAPYWVNFHAEHHLFMHVPCWKLPALHRAVRARPQGERMEVARGYLAVLAEASAKA